MSEVEKNFGGVGTESPLNALAGRELDAAVAERVMGWQRQPDYNYWMTFPNGSFQLHALIATWKPSTNIADAMEVVEKMRNAFSNVSMHAANGWDVGFWNIDEEGKCHDYTEGNHLTSLPQAICRAALAAVESEAHKKMSSTTETVEQHSQADLPE